MRALVYADVHVTDGHEKLHSDPTQSLQIYRVRKFYTRLLEIYREQKCDCLWDLGDTTDDRSSVPIPAIVTLHEGLSQFPLSEWNLMVIGNHQQFLRNATIDCGPLFSPFFTVLSQPQAYETPEGVRLLICPYPAKETELQAWITSQKTTKQPTILLGHFQMIGSFGAGGKIMAGMEQAPIDWVTLGLLGHVHKPQQIGRYFYVGSPFQQNWGEKDEEKRVAIVDISPAGKLKLSWVPLTGFPRYLEVDFDWFDKHANDQSEDRWRVRLRSTEEASRFFAHPLAHRAEPLYAFSVQPDQESKDKVTTSASSWNVDDVLRRYMDKNPPSARGIALPKAEMLGVGQELVSS